MKVFDGYWKCYHPGPGRYTEFKSCLIVANTKEEALGLALARYDYTDSVGWELEEIDTTIPAVHHYESGEY